MPQVHVAAPKNILEVIKGNLGDYRLCFAYCLELEHRLMGNFYCVFRGTRSIVVSADPTVIKGVWRTLKPRRSKVTTNLFYVNDSLGVGYPILPLRELEESKPFDLVTREKFIHLYVDSTEPAFEWASGLMDVSWNQKDFIEMIEGINL